MDDLLKLVTDQQAEGLRLEPGQPPLIMRRGHEEAVDPTPLSEAHAVELFHSIATGPSLHEFDRSGDVHFDYTSSAASRFHVIAFRRHETFSLMIQNLAR